jgi:hypothetical protein
MIFRPFHRSPSTPVFPAWVRSQLGKPAIPRARLESVTPASHLSDVISKRGLSIESICELINQPDGKTDITPALVESALAGDPDKFWIINRIFNALNISWDDHLRLEKQHDELLHRAVKTRKQAQFLHNQYHSAGPSLHALPIVESWIATLCFADPYHLTRQVHTGAKYQFLTPTAQEMAQIIATQPEPCTHPGAHKFHVIGAFLYHRYPNELHLFDPRGKLLASGDSTLPIPNHLMLYQPKAHLDRS